MLFGALSALGNFGNSAFKADEAAHASWMEELGKQALGNALRPDQPMAPPPGQASMPSRPQQPPQGGMPQQPQGMPPEMQRTPMAQQQQPMTAGLPQAAMQPQGGMPQQSVPQQGPPQMAQTPQGMMPQLDLPTLMQRIAQRNPNLPPAAMISALNHALPMLNQDAKYQLALMQQQYRQDMLGLRERGLDDRVQMFNQNQQRLQGAGTQANDVTQRRLDLREKDQQLRGKALDLKEKGVPPTGTLKEGHVTTFANGQQWTLQGGQPVQVGGGQGMGQGQGGEQGMGQGQGGEQQGSYAGNLSGQEANALRLRSGFPLTLDEFRRHFKREPSTDAEIDAYSEQLRGEPPFEGRPNSRKRR